MFVACGIASFIRCNVIKLIELCFLTTYFETPCDILYYMHVRVSMSVCSEDGLMLETSAVHRTSRAKKHTISTIADQNPY